MEAVTAAVGGSVLSACIEGVFDRLNSIDWLEYVGRGQVLDHLNKWEKMLSRISSVLDDAEGKETSNRLIEIWLADLKDIAYDIEDLLDELATEAQQQKLENEDHEVQPSKLRRIFFSVFSALNPRALKFNVEMISKIEQITTRLYEIVKEKDDLYLGESNRRRVDQVSERLPSTSLANEARVFGREEDKEAVIKLLNAENGFGDVVVIPIIGMGGVGKTTLAQLVYNERSLEFDFKAWVSVGEDFDVLRITKAILQSRDGDDNDLNFFQEKLKQKLAVKTFLVVLDDVWCENYEQWTLFRSPFDAGASGGSIIITTRNLEVSYMTGTVPAYPLKELAYDECLSVFAQHALGATNFNQHLDLEEIGREIVKRCKGLPLAAKALGGLLRGKQNLNAWKEVLNSEIWDLPNNRAIILPALKLSYLYLPPQLKRSFAYCAIFPKDYQFDRDELVLLWKAEGFLYCPRRMKQTEDLGRRYFDDLLSRSFFQQSNDNKSRYVMHDLIHDLARFVSRDTCYHLVNNELNNARPHANTRHSSFVPQWSNTFQRFECFYEMKKLRTFLSVQQSNFGYFLSRKVVHDLLPKLKCLRVLSLTGCWSMELPSLVGELKRLRYLVLSYTSVERLPESLGKLLNLETLKLQYCHELVELPKSICKLINLQYLDISNTYKLKELPLQIVDLTNLRVLGKFVVGQGNKGLRISDLKRFSQLEGKLRIEGLENVVDFRDSGFVNLKEKLRLLELDLVWKFRPSDSECRQSIHEEVLNSLELHPNLLRLSIMGFCGTSFPLWIRHPIFNNMVELKLHACLYITSLPPLGRLPSLKALSIIRMDRVKEVGSEFYEDYSSFSSLETLQIEDMKALEKWSWCNGTSEDALQIFHKLRELRIVDCPKLLGKLPSIFPCLEKLEIWDCPQLVDSPKELPCLVRLSIDGCQEAVLKNLCVPRLTELKIRRMLGLERLDESYFRALAALKNFDVDSCDELRYLWADGTNVGCLTNLRHLLILSCQKLVSLVDREEGRLPCNLESLSIYDCNNLKRLPKGLHNLKSLKDFCVTDCGELVSFPFSGLPYSLKHLTISDCPSLEVLYNSEMSYLESLEVRNCYSISCFPNYKFSGSIKTLIIQKGNKQFIELLYFGFSHLTCLVISDCSELVSYPERELHMSSLISFTISNCNGLKRLCYHIQSLNRLQNFQIDNCRNLRSLASQLPPKLSELTVQSCENLCQPLEKWGLRSLTYLRKLKIGNIGSTRNMISFPDDEGLLLPTTLKELIIYRFENLKTISRGILNLTSLRSFSMDECPVLQFFPDDGLPPTLESLVILLCPHLIRRCLKDQGDYWPKISHIPCIQLKFQEQKL